MTEIVAILAKAQPVVNHFCKGFPFPLQQLPYYRHPWTMIGNETTERETKKKLTTTNNSIPSIVFGQEINENGPSKVLRELLLITDLWLYHHDNKPLAN